MAQTVSEFRRQYPQYNDIPDDELRRLAASRGIDVRPDQYGALENAWRSAQQALRGIGGGAYRVLEEGAERVGAPGVRDWATEELRRREIEMQRRAERMRTTNFSDFTTDPIGVTSGAIGMAAGSLPLALTPAGWGLMFAGLAGENIEEQREARGAGTGEANLPLALGTAGVQTALERLIGLEGWAARGFGRGAGRTVLGRGAEGFVRGSVGEAFTEGAQEALTIAQGDTDNVGRVLDPESLERIGQGAFLGGLGGGAIRGALSMTGREREPEAPVQDMSMRDALGVIQGSAPPPPTVTAGSVQAGPNIPGAPTAAAPMNSVVEQAILSPDTVERDMALSSGIPLDIRTAAILRYRAQRDARRQNLVAGVERPPGQAGERPGSARQPQESRELVPQGDPSRASARTTDAPEAGGVQPPGVEPMAATQPATMVQPPPGSAPDPDAVPAAQPAATAQPQAQPEVLPIAPEAATETAPAQETAPTQEAAPDPERVRQAQEVVDKALRTMEARGRQGEEVARALRSMIDDKLKTRQLTPDQAAVAFDMMEAASNILPANAGQQIGFFDRLTGRSGQEIQGDQTRLPQATPEGMQGLIRLSLAENQLPLARETAAHEAWHVIEDWLRATDPKVHRELQRAFPAGPDGTVKLQDVDASLVRLLKRNEHPSGRSYYEYLAADETGFGPGVFRNPSEAQATVFGALYDIRSNGGKTTPMKPLLRRAFDFFTNMMDRMRASPSRALMERVASGQFRQQQGNTTADLTAQEASNVADPATRQSARDGRDVAPELQPERSTEREGQVADGDVRDGQGEGRDLGRPDLRPVPARTGEAPAVRELPAGQAARFVQAITASRQAHPMGAAVYVYPETSSDGETGYDRMRLFMTDDGMAGFALKDAGNGVVDIVSAFSNPRSGRKGMGDVLIQEAVRQGGNKLDAFDTVLPHIYGRNGFRASTRMSWNDDYAPDGWDKSMFREFNNGEPDVVFMHYDPNGPNRYEREGERVQDYDEAVRRQEDDVRRANNLTRESARLLSNEELGAGGFPISQWGAIRTEDFINRLDPAEKAKWEIASRRVRQMMDEAKAPIMAGDMLEEISKTVSPKYRPLINAYRKAIPSNMPVIWPGLGLKSIKSTSGMTYKIDLNAGDQSYFQATNDNYTSGYIHINPKQKAGGKDVNAAITVFHEAGHAATMAEIFRVNLRAMKGDPESKALIGVLDQMRKAVADFAIKNMMMTERLHAGSIAYYTRGSSDATTVDLVSPMSGRAEFVTEMLLDPYFQSFAAQVPVTQEIEQSLEALGVKSRPKNMLDAMIEWVKKVFGLPDNSVLDAFFLVAPSYITYGNSIPEATQESARQLPPSVRSTLDRIAPSQPAGYLGRVMTNKPWKAGMRAEVAQWLRTKLVDRYSVVEDLERTLTGNSRLPAELSGFTSLWMAEETERFLSAMMDTGGHMKLVRNDPSNPENSYFRVEAKRPGGIGWLTDMLTGVDPATGKPGKKPDGSPRIETSDEAKALMSAFQMYAIAKRGTNLNAAGILVPIGAKERAAAADAERAFPEIAHYYQKYQEFNKGLMDLAVDSGVLKRADANAFMKHNDYYPFYRAIPSTDPLGARRIAGISAKFKPKEIIGGDKPFVDDALTVILNNASYWMHASMRNVAKQKVVSTALKVGAAVPFDKSKHGADTKINVRYGGVDYAYASSDPALTSALESYWGLPGDLQNVLRVAGWPARFLREMVTKNPTFMLFSNPVRDSVAAWQATGSNIAPIIDTYKGLVQAMQRDQPTMDYVALGHGGSRRYEDAMFRDAGDLLRDDILVRKGIYRADTPGVLMGVLRKAYLKLDRVSEASDLATRLPVFEAERAKGFSEAEAAWRAREIINFTKRGNSTVLQMLSMLVPFTNARVQGMDVMFQGLTGGRMGDIRESRNDRMGRSLARGAILTMVALGLQMAAGDDEEMKQAPESLRNTNVLVPLRMLGLAEEGLLAIPKPFEFGALFMTLPEQLYRYVNGERSGSGTARDAVSGIFSSIAYNPIPTGALPIIEQMMNYNMFTGRPIIGRALESQSPEWQFTRNTPAAYREMARWMAQSGIPFPEFMRSPERMNHAVRSLTGALGTQAAVFAGTIAGVEEFRSYDWRRLPILSALIRSKDTTPPRGLEGIYELADASDRLSQQMRRYTAIGDMAMVRRLSEENSALIQAKPEIDRIRNRLRLLSRQERELIRDSRIPAEERRERLTLIERQKREAVAAVDALMLRAGR